MPHPLSAAAEQRVQPLTLIHPIFALTSASLPLPVWSAAARRRFLMARLDSPADRLPESGFSPLWRRRPAGSPASTLSSRIGSQPRLCLSWKKEVHSRIVPARLPIRRPVLISTVGPIASAVMVLLRWVYMHKEDQDFYLTAANYAVAWLPFAFSILIAFIPDMRKAHMFWRALVILAGLTYSVVLFKQQYLALEASRRDQEKAVNLAVQKSNQHYDQQIGAVRSDVQGVKKDLEKKIDETISKSTSDITGGLSTVGKPEPAELARLQYTFWSDAINSAELPPITQIRQELHQGTVTVEFTIKNISGVPAEDGELWISICNTCQFAKEPEGFVRLKGAPEQDRHKTFQRLLQGVAFEKMAAEIKPPPMAGRLEINLFYACTNCEVITKPGPNKQVLFVDIVPSVPMQP